MEHITPESVDQEIESLVNEASEAGGVANTPAVQGEYISHEENRKEWEEIFNELLTPSFEYLAPGWGVSGDEISHLSKAYSRVAAKYFPDAADMMPEITAGLLTLAVFGPRMKAKMPRKNPEQSGQHTGEQTQKSAPAQSQGGGKISGKLNEVSDEG